jgi:alpha-N-arabinofuranosidase
MESDAAHYDNYDRKGPKIFVGEWATREGSPTPNFNAALGDAAWMTGMERNSDIVVMSCYAPLFVNVNPGAMQWKSDLIGYNTLNSYGSPSYYAQVMFNNYKGDHVVPMIGSDIPTQMQQLSKKDLDRGIKAKELPAVFYVATKDNKTGTIYLNFVNTQSTPQQVKIDLQGANKVNKNGSLIVLKANNREETNSITDPEKIIPVKENINGLAKEFVRTFPAYSISILQIGTK